MKPLSVGARLMDEDPDIPDAGFLHEEAVEYGQAPPAPLRMRTKEYALRIIRLTSALPKTTEAQVIGKQVLRSGTSIGAHYREAQRSRSQAEVISKLELALQELEETRYWIELLDDAGIVPSSRLEPLLGETDELNAILTTCVIRVKSRKR